MSGRTLKGLVPLVPISGEIRTRRIAVDASNATAIFKNDPIKQEADGNATPSGADGDCLGVAVSLLDSDKHPLSYLPVSTAGYVEYVPWNACLFIIGEDADGGKLSDRTAVYDLVATAGDTTSGYSNYEIDSSDASGSFVHIVSESPFWGDATGDTYPKWVVEIIGGQLAAS